MTTDLLVLYFGTTSGAQEAVVGLRSRDQKPAGWVDEVAIVERREAGRIATHTSFASTTQGAAVGGLTGLVVGLLFPPVGVLALLGGGAAVGAGLEKIAKENGLDARVFDAVKDSLEPGSSAVVLVGAAADVDELTSALRSADTTRVVREPMPEKAVSNFWSVLENAPAD